MHSEQHIWEVGNPPLFTFHPGPSLLTVQPGVWATPSPPLLPSFSLVRRLKQKREENSPAFFFKEQELLIQMYQLPIYIVTNI